MRAVLLTLVLALAACGPSTAARRAQTLIDAGDYAAAAELATAELQKNPKDGDLWRVRIRASLGQNDAGAAVAAYAEWRAVRGEEDHGALRMMAMTTLWQGLESPQQAARVEAIRAVERLEIERLADAVADQMVSDDDVVAAAASIAILRAYPQAPQVAGELLGSAEARARAIVVEGIARKVGKRAADDLRQLAGDPDPNVRRVLARALGGFQDPADTERLSVLAKDADAEVRAAALHALSQGKRGDLSALARAALDDEHLGVRIAAVALLDASGDDATLVSLLKGDDHAIAAHAARALMKTHKADAAAALDRALADSDWSVRVGALNLATSIVGADAARGRAEKLLGDTTVDVRVAAARLLGNDPRAVEVLAAALTDDHVGVHAAADLAKLGDERGLTALARFSQADKPAQRRAAVDGHAVARRVTPGLVGALADDDPVIRIAAAATLLDVVPAD
jgi:HEAT repeat protein